MTIAQPIRQEKKKMSAGRDPASNHAGGRTLQRGRHEITVRTRTARLAEIQPIPMTGFQSLRNYRQHIRRPIVAIYPVGGFLTVQLSKASFGLRGRQLFFFSTTRAFLKTGYAGADGREKRSGARTLRKQNRGALSTMGCDMASAFLQSLPRAQ